MQGDKLAERFSGHAGNKLKYVLIIIWFKRNTHQDLVRCLHYLLGRLPADAFD
jgi:hypothetical protein